MVAVMKFVKLSKSLCYFIWLFDFGNLERGKYNSEFWGKKNWELSIVDFQV